MEELNLKLQGMSCASCANSIEQAILNVPGVVNCHVNFSTDRATVRYDAQKTNGNIICQAVADVGYAAQIISLDLTAGDDTKTTQLQDRHLQRRVLIGAILSLLLVLGTLSY